MRLTKLEKQLDLFIADGYTADAIAAALLLVHRVEQDQLFVLMESLRDKHKAEADKLAKARLITTRNEILAPKIRHLKCQNLGKENPKYWLFTGQESDVFNAHEQFLDLGITVTIRKNGNNGIYWLLVPSWVTGELLPQGYLNWLNDKQTESEGEKEYVNDSIGETADTATNCFDSGFEYFGEIQSQDIECFA